MVSGDDPAAMVDNQVRGRGIRGVRCADTTIMPHVTSGNSHARAVMIGERYIKDWIINIKVKKINFRQK